MCEARVENYEDTDRWTKMSVAELTTPKAGYLCYGPAWWAITKDGCVLFFHRGTRDRHGSKYQSPQCNQNREVVKRIRSDCEQQFIEMAFLPHDCHDYC